MHRLFWRRFVAFLPTFNAKLLNGDTLMTESWRQICESKFGYTYVCILCFTAQKKGFGYTLEIPYDSMHVLETL